MNTSTMSRAAPLPWYKQGWPWFLLAFPATAVIAGLITFWIAWSTWDGLVVDDYYQQGKAIEKTLARSIRAGQMGLAAEVTVRAEEIGVRLSAADGVPLPPTVVASITHPTRGGQDQTVLLTLRDGVFAGPIEPLPTGRWLIQLEDESKTWRLNGALYVPTETQVRILPTDS